MALTPQINGNKATTLVVIRANTAQMRVNKGAQLAVVNFPTEEVQANSAKSLTVHRSSNDMNVNKAVSLVVCKGRVAKPNMLVWTFAIDQHEFLVVQLQSETLVYDFLAEKWYTWGSGNWNKWAVQLGQNWNANLGFLMSELGGATMSGVVCGDDTTGTLYFLDPVMPEDSNAAGDGTQPFRRVITGQLAMRGHDYVDVPAVELTGSNGETGGISNPLVSLEISDNRGHSYWEAGTQSVLLGSYDVTLSWRSLGSFTGPGRLFRFVDYGAIARVDGLDIPDGS